MKQTVLKVEGMTCDQCVRSVTTVLEGLPGVSKAVASLDHERVVIDHAPEAPVESMIKAIEGEGYGAVRE